MIFLSIFYKNKKGGFTKRLYQLIHHIACEGYQIHFISAEPLPFEDPKIIQHIIRAPFTKQENLLFWLCFSVASIWVSHYIDKKYKITNIVTFGPFYTALLFLPICVSGVSAVSFIRADNLKHSSKMFRNALLYIIDWIGIKLSKRIVVVNQTLKTVYSKRYGIDQDKIRVQPNNIERQYNEDENLGKARTAISVAGTDFLITTAGPFNEGKNFSLIIKAIRSLSRERVRLAIIGDEVAPTGEKKRLEDLTTSLGLEKNVIFCGWQDSPLPLIKSSDVFVYPSKHEGSPNALLEALGCSIPCIGSRIPEIQEVLYYDELLFSVEEPKELSRKLYMMLNDPAYRKMLAKLCKERQRVFCFDWKKAAFGHILALDGAS